MSTRVDPATTHSGKYSCAVASRVKSRGATGSPENTIVVTPADFIFEIACDAVAWIVAGSSAYTTVSANGAPAASIASANSCARSAAAPLESRYR